MISKNLNNAVLICKKNSELQKKMSSINVMCSVTRPHFLQMAKSIGIMFALDMKKNFHATIQHKKDLPKVNVVCANSKNHVYVFFFFLREM